MSKILPWNSELIRHFSLKDDLFAALTVAVVIIPQGMAYAMLAELPPIYGLYAAFIPLLIYPFFGSSRHLSVGPVALVSIILLAGLSTMAAPGSSEYIRLALLTSLVAGIIQLVLSLLRMGFLVKFLSEPVMHGFTSAAATIIILSQLKSILGIDISGTSNLIQILKEVGSQIQTTHLITFFIGITALVILLALKKIKRTFPAGLFVVIIGTILMYAFKWNESGVGIVGLVPQGLPKFTSDFINFNDIIRVFPLAFIICLISFIESLAIAKSISARHDHYVIHANQELLGLGLAKLIGSFFLAFPNTGSFSRSAVNDEAGAKSGFSSIFTALLIGVILLFFTPLFYYLPKPVLGAIVISAVLGLLNFGYARRLLVHDRKDFYVYLATFILTLILGIQQGVLAGIILSIIMILQKSSKPHYAVLGQLPGTQTFRNINRFPDAAVRADILILRYDQDIYFGNAEHFFDTLEEQIDNHPDTQKLILNASAIAEIDSTGISMFKLLLKIVKQKNIKFIITQIRGPVRDRFAQTCILETIGIENIYLSIADAINYETTGEIKSELKKTYASQSTKKRSKR